MSTEPEEVILTVPADLTKRCKGLAIDIGGSLLKFIFRTKDDIEKASTDESKFSRLHLVSFPRNSLREGLEYVKKNAYFQTENDNDGPQELYTTGLGCTEFGKLINETLNVRLTNLTEFDCFVKSFVYLAENLPRSEFLEKHEAEVFETILQTAPMATQLLTIAFQQKTYTPVAPSSASKLGRPTADHVEPPSKEPLAEVEEDLFPCMLVVCGSGFVFIKVEKDGTFSIPDGSMRSGAAFAGIGKLLTGAKTFDELIDLAIKGDQHNVDRFISDFTTAMRSADDDKSMYKNFLNEEVVFDEMLFSFGKVAASDSEFRREDVARSWLNYFAMDLTQTVQIVCAVNNIKRVFFCGGFCANKLVRLFITQELAKRSLWNNVLTKDASTVTFDFIKPGQHLGALGCILRGLD